MGLEARHAYRFGYLQSEHWQNLRVQKLAECDARCHICNHRDIANDVHHIHYPEDLYKTKLCVLYVLCRKHHAQVHEYMDRVKASRSSPPKGEWQAFRYHLETFKHACRSIENGMIKEGVTCYTSNGVRLRNDGHMDRILPMRYAMEESLISEIKGAKTRISKAIKALGAEERFTILSHIDDALAEAEAIMARKRNQFAIDFIRNETAGTK